MSKESNAPLCECGCPKGSHKGQRLNCVQCRMCKRYVASKRNTEQRKLFESESVLK